MQGEKLAVKKPADDKQGQQPNQWVKQPPKQPEGPPAKKKPKTGGQPPAKPTVLLCILSTKTAGSASSSSTQELHLGKQGTTRVLKVGFLRPPPLRPFHEVEYKRQVLYAFNLHSVLFVHAFCI